MNSDAPLLTFDHPPVTEVVVALSFRPLSQLTVAHLGLLWREALADAFPHIEERPPYEPSIERFDGSVSPGFSLMIGDGPPLPRLWFKSPDDQELLQVQRNWFACNWRKVQPKSKYGRWPSRREAFRRWFGAFADFLQAENLGEVKPSHCEVTYINHVVPNEAWDRHGQLDRILRVVGDAPPPLDSPEETSYRSKYVIRRDEEPIGRLHIQCDPVVNTKDGSPAYLLNLTARGAPLAASLDGAMEFFELGRRWIVEGFESVTTEAMHSAWGLQRE